MHVDVYDLPVQADGDHNDQLARAAELAVALKIDNSNLQGADLHTAISCYIAVDSMHGMLQPSRGLWVRYTGGATNSPSADQIISALCSAVISGDWEGLLFTALRTILRLGFAQNYRNTLDGSNSFQIPDFMLLRALPLFTRLHKVLYPLTLLLDLLLIFAAFAAVGPVWQDGKGFAKRSPDDVDDNVIILTLIACNSRMPTPFSRLARKIYAKWRSWNYGCEVITPVPDGVVSMYTHHPVIGALLWYHRADSGGNPQIAQALIPAVKKYILD